MWEVINGEAAPRAGHICDGVECHHGRADGAFDHRLSPCSGSADGSSAIVLSGNTNPNAYLYSGLTDVYTASRQLFTGAITGYDGPLGVSPNGSYLLANGMVLNSALTQIGGATLAADAGDAPGPAGEQRRVEPIAQCGGGGAGRQNVFLRMTTPVRTTITTATTDDVTRPRACRYALRRGVDRSGNAGKSGYSVFNNTRTPMPAAANGGGWKRNGLRDHTCRA